MYKYSAEFSRWQSQPPHGAYTIKVWFEVDVDWYSYESGPEVDKVYNAAWNALWERVAQFPNLQDTRGYSSWIGGPIRRER